MFSLLSAGDLSSLSPLCDEPHSESARGEVM
jgi:hypothetical protein